MGVLNALKGPVRRTRRLLGAIARRARDQVFSTLLQRRLPGNSPLLVHLGCGSHRFDGWVNVDIIPPTPADLRWDLRRGFPAPAGSVRLFYSEHFLEHLTLDEGRRLLRDCRRSLAPGGIVRIAMPDLATAVENYATGKWTEIDIHDDDLLRVVQTAGEYLNLAMRGWGHQYLYDFPELERRLLEAGFSGVTRRGWGRSEVPELQGRESRPTSRLIVEAEV